MAIGRGSGGRRDLHVVSDESPVSPITTAAIPAPDVPPRAIPSEHDSCSTSTPDEDDERGPMKKKRPPTKQAATAEKRRHEHEAEAGVVGAFTGAAIGGISGPAGAVAGAVIGGTVGAAAVGLAEKSVDDHDEIE
jgi:hypothetical protein